MRILGIDQSMTSSGIVIFDDTTLIHHQLIKTSKDDGSNFLRFNIISSEIILLIKNWNIKQVNIEGLPMGRSIGNSHKTLAALQGVIISKIIEQCNIESKIIAPTAVKKFATGSGRAKKDEMVHALPEAILKLFINSNLKKSTGLYDCTDAYFIATFQ